MIPTTVPELTPLDDDEVEQPVQEEHVQDEHLFEQQPPQVLQDHSPELQRDWRPRAE